MATTALLNIDDDSASKIATLDTPIPSDPFEPQLYSVLVMPIGSQPRTMGGIIIPQTTRDDQHWSYALARVVRLGEFAFKSVDWKRKFPDFDPDVHGYKPGDLVLINPKTPRKQIYDGRLLLQVGDNEIQGRARPDQAEKFEFAGVKLRYAEPQPIHVSRETEAVA
jgi:co-chaperonin GroES (HSP10)